MSTSSLSDAAAPPADGPQARGRDSHPGLRELSTHPTRLPGRQGERIVRLSHRWKGPTAGAPFGPPSGHGCANEGDDEHGGGRRDYQGTERTGVAGNRISHDLDDEMRRPLARPIPKSCWQPHRPDSPTALRQISITAAEKPVRSH
jgi:hypothetical protein